MKEKIVYCGFNTDSHGITTLGRVVLDAWVLLSRIRQLVDDLTMERWLTFEKAHSSVPPGLLVVLVSWLAVMFASFGLFAPRNATALTALFVGALAVSTSIFLIEEMNRPFEGWIALSADTMGTTLAVLGR